MTSRVQARRSQANFEAALQAAALNFAMGMDPMEERWPSARNLQAIGVDIGSRPGSRDQPAMPGRRASGGSGGASEALALADGAASA